MKNYLKPITDIEIEYAEKLLLPKGEKFDEKERRKIIRCMKSASIEACPGSGKTTTLLAKLIILASRAPFNDGKGICVLTHTNVAIDEIKLELGAKSDVLFKYPNYFGTLQTFIDRYLSIPYYKEKYNMQITMIDDDIVEKKYNTIYEKNKKYIHGNYDNSKNHFDFRENLFKVGDKVLYRDPNKYLYKECKKIIEGGYLKFSEAIQLGGLYLEKYPMLKELFSNRFAFIFVDEMQDTSKESYKILQKLFDNEKSIIQYIGDSNQDILKNEVTWKMKKELSILESKRYGQEIANFISPLRIKNPNDENLKGNENQTSFLPHLIIFENDKKEKVLDKYIEIIKENKLHNNKNAIFKVVGGVGKKPANDQKHIGCYYKNFIGKGFSDKLNFNYLETKLKNKNSENKEILNLILKISSYFLNALEIKIKEKKINKNSLYKYLEDENIINDFKYQVYKYMLDEEYFDDMKREIYSILKKCFNIKGDKTTNFNDYFKIDTSVSKTRKSNIYKKDEIEVYIDTVHGVKGETHTATLYLETYNKSDDLKQIMNYLFKEKKPKCKSKPDEKMKLCFVGFSRATHLLCLAIEKTDKLDELLLKNTSYLNGKIKIIRL